MVKYFLVKTGMIFRGRRKDFANTVWSVWITVSFTVFMGASICYREDSAGCLGSFFCWGVALTFAHLCVFPTLRGQRCRRFWARGRSLVLCGLLSPCKTLCNFLSPPTAEYGNPAVSGHFCNYSHNSRGSCSHPPPFCLEAWFAFENVSLLVECPPEPSSLLSLCCPAVLQLKLQQRRTREELVSQGIMPRKYPPLSQHLREWLLGPDCGHPTQRAGSSSIFHSSGLCSSKFRPLHHEEWGQLPSWMEFGETSSRSLRVSN